MNNKEVGKSLQDAIGAELTQKNYDLIDLVQVPQTPDRALKLRSIEEMVMDFETPGEDETLSYIVRIRPKKNEPKTNAAVSGQVPDLGEIYLSNGRINSEYLIRNAQILLEAGDYLLAKNIYRTVLQAGGNNHLALDGIGQCYEKQGYLDKAQSSYEDSIAYLPTFETIRRLASVLIKTKRYRYAAETLERALKINDLKDEIRFELHKACGNCWMRSEENEKAEGHYKRALEIKPDADETQSNIGSVLLRQEKIALAKQAFFDALASNPQNDKAHVGLGCCSLAMGDKEGAHDHFVRGLNIYLNNPTAIYYLVKCAYDTKKYDVAEQIVSEYVQIALVNVNLLFSLAGMQYHLGKIKEARMNVKKVLDLKPGHKGAEQLQKLLG